MALIVSKPSSSTTTSEGAPLPALASFFARMISLFLGRCLGLEGSSELGCTICGMLVGRGGRGGRGLSLGGSGGRDGVPSSFMDCALLVFGDFFLGVATGGLASPTDDVESDDSLLVLLAVLFLGCWSIENCWNEKFK